MLTFTTVSLPPEPGRHEDAWQPAFLQLSAGLDANAAG